MFYKSECYCTEKPVERDTSSSKKMVYLRKDFVFIPSHADEITGETVPDKWEYMEAKIPREALTLLQMTDSNSDDISLVKDAICELSTLMIGE